MKPPLAKTGCALGEYILKVAAPAVLAFVDAIGIDVFDWRIWIDVQVILCYLLALVYFCVAV